MEFLPASWEHIMDKMNKVEMNSAYSSRIYDKFRKFVLRNVMERPVTTVFVVIGGLFLFAFIFLGILRLADLLLRYIDCDFLSFVRLKGGVESWFAFYGSFFGVIATVVLGIIAMRVDVKFQWSEQATQINRLSLLEMRLYDFKRDYRPSILVKDGDSRRFMLMLVFDRFDPYYEIAVKKVMWKGVDSEDDVAINSHNICVKNAGQMVIYLNFNDIDAEETEKTFNYFYRIRCYDSMMMELKKRQRQLKLELLLNKSSYSKKVEISVNLEVTLENGGYHEGYMVLEQKNYLLKIAPFF